jgi:hypothetical protein
MRSLLAAFLLLLLVTPLRADDSGVFSSVDDAAKKKGKGAPLVVLFVKSGSDDEKAAKALLVDKRVLKIVNEGATPVRIDPGDDESSKKLGIDAEKGGAVVLDGYGVLSVKKDKLPGADDMAKLLKAAQETTAKKKKIEKTLDDGLARAEKALEKDDTKTACELLAKVLELEKEVPCDATAKARKKADALEEKGKSLLGQARSAVGDGEYAKANKLITEALSKYPLPEVQSEAKQVKKELAEAEGSE